MRGNPRNLDSNKEKDTFLNSGLLVSNFAFFFGRQSFVASANNKETADGC